MQMAWKTKKQKLMSVVNLILDNHSAGRIRSRFEQT